MARHAGTRFGPEATLRSNVDSARFAFGHGCRSTSPAASGIAALSMSYRDQGIVEHHSLPPDQAAEHAIGWPHFLDRLTIADMDENRQTGHPCLAPTTVSTG